MSEIIQGKDSLASDVLKEFFGISPARVREELEFIDLHESGFRELEREFWKTGWEHPVELAESFHRRRLLGRRMSLFSRLPRDLILFSAAVTAHEIAELSCSTSTGKGKLLELAERFETLEEEQGMLANRKAGHGEELLERIHDSVFLEVLERYELGHFARLFESDRPLYEIRFEVGRRLVDAELVDGEEHLDTVSRFKNQFGPEYVQEFLRRLEYYDLLPG